MFPNLFDALTTLVSAAALIAALRLLLRCRRRGQIGRDDRI